MTEHTLIERLGYLLSRISGSNDFKAHTSLGDTLASDVIKQAIQALKSSQWVKIDDDDGNSVYGFHPGWIDGDFCPDGVREICYEGDHYASNYWCGSHDEWKSTSTVLDDCLLYTSPSPRDQRGSRMPSSA